VNDNIANKTLLVNRKNCKADMKDKMIAKIMALSLINPSLFTILDGGVMNL